MLSVVLIGTGNVSRQLCSSWRNNPSVEVVQVVGRTLPEKPEFEGRPLARIEDITPHADCYIIAVSDSSILTVNENITISSGLVVHTSGSTAMDVLAPRRQRGVLYPLQTFSAGRKVNMGDIPVFLETNDPGDKPLLKKLAASLSKKLYWLDSSKRQQLHLSAIFLNNFMNHVLYVSGEACKGLDLDFEVLHPLLHETIAKAIAMGPYAAQTGPARRGDMKVIEKHLALIKDTAQREIYKVISQSIQSTYENELQKLA